MSICSDSPWPVVSVYKTHCWWKNFMNKGLACHIGTPLFLLNNKRTGSWANLTFFGTVILTSHLAKSQCGCTWSTSGDLVSNLFLTLSGPLDTNTEILVSICSVFHDQCSSSEVWYPWRICSPTLLASFLLPYSNLHRHKRHSVQNICEVFAATTNRKLRRRNWFNDRTFTWFRAALQRCRRTHHRSLAASVPLCNRPCRWSSLTKTRSSTDNPMEALSLKNITFVNFWSLKVDSFLFRKKCEVTRARENVSNAEWISYLSHSFWTVRIHEASQLWPQNSFWPPPSKLLRRWGKLLSVASILRCHNPETWPKMKSEKGINQQWKVSHIETQTGQILSAKVKHSVITIGHKERRHIHLLTEKQLSSRAPCTEQLHSKRNEAPELEWNKNTNSVSGLCKWPPASGLNGRWSSICNTMISLGQNLSASMLSGEIFLVQHELCDDEYILHTRILGKSKIPCQSFPSG